MFDDENSNETRLISKLLGGDGTPVPSHGTRMNIFQHPEKGWVIFDFLRCVSVPPQKSHPNRYWFRNSRIFRHNWSLKQALDGTLYLINYADDPEMGIRQIDIHEMDENGVIEESIKNWDFDDFAAWFRQFDQDCAENGT